MIEMEKFMEQAQNEMGWHDVAGVFPLMSEEAMEGLIADIKTSGLMDPIRTMESDDGEELVVDGRNRQIACIAAGVDRIYEPLADDAGMKVEELAAKIWSLNFTRRHLTPSQLGMAAAEMRKLLAGTIPRAAEVTGASQRNTERASRVMGKGSVELIKSVQDGTVTLFEAEKIIGLDQDEQTRRVHLLRQGKIKTVSVMPTPKPEPQTKGEAAWLAAVQEPYDIILKKLGEALSGLEVLEADVELSQYLPATRIKVDINAARNNVYQNYPLHYHGGPGATKETHPESSGVGFLTRFCWDQLDSESKRRGVDAQQNEVEEIPEDEPEHAIPF